MPRWFKLLLIALIAFRIASVFYAFDCRPMVTNNDEIYWAEPAWSLNHGYGYRMPCCEGMLFGDFYPQHPPFYVLLLAGSYRLFGFTPEAIRFPSMIAHLVSVVILLSLLWRLRRLHVLSQFGFHAAAILAATDFSTQYVSRWGRPDPFTTLFALVGLLTLIGGRLKGNPIKWRALIASICIGLALMTHTVAVFYFGVFAVAILFLRKRIGTLTALACLIVPWIMLAATWYCTFGARSWEALLVHQKIASQMGGINKQTPWRVLEIVTGAINQTEFLQTGGTTAILILATFAIFVAALFTPKTQKYRWPIWLAFAAVMAGQLALIFCLISLGITRCYIYFPTTVIVIGFLVSNCRTWQRAAFMIVCLMAAMEIGQTSYLIYGTYHDRDLRLPNRHQALIDRLAKYDRVAVLPVLWYQARARGLNFELIDLSVSMQHDEWLGKQHPLAEFDAVVLNADHELCNNVDLTDIKPEEFPEPMARRGLLLYERRPPRR